MKKSIRHTLLIGAILLLAGMAFAAWQAHLLLRENIVSKDGESHVIYVYPQTSLAQLMDSVEQYYEVRSPRSLGWHCRLMKWSKEHVRTGKYLLPERMGSYAFIGKFRSGDQQPVRLTFNNIRLREQLASRLSSQLMIDSAAIANLLCDSTFAHRMGFEEETILAMFLPNTYEVWWDISAEQLMERMHREYLAFWNADRQAAAAAIPLTQVEVSILASIVEEETNIASDKPIIAGLYINRLRIGMPLQSCPTVKYAWQDFGLRRVLNKHLEIDSPYNTYRNQGLPPGPIRIPTAQTLDAVLHYTPSNYLYMCASEKLDGTHHFSSTGAQHAAYARLYQQELNRRKIR